MKKQLVPADDATSTLEDKFWSRVWRCTHKHPCKRCCWPWISFNGLYHFCELPSTFTDLRLPKLKMPAYQVAYLLGQGTPVLSSRIFYICHTCDYKPCCNYAHLRPGTHGDNVREVKSRIQALRRPVRLPDGRLFSYLQRMIEGPKDPAPRKEYPYRFQWEILHLYDNDYESPRGYAHTDYWSELLAFIHPAEKYCVREKKIKRSIPAILFDVLPTTS